MFIYSWKIKVNLTLSTRNESQKEYMRKEQSGRRCVYQLEDDSGKINLVAFDEYAKALESYQLKENVQVRLIIM